MAKIVAEAVEQAIGFHTLPTGKRSETHDEAPETFFQPAEVALVALHPLERKVILALPDVLLHRVALVHVSTVLVQAVAAGCRARAARVPCLRDRRARHSRSATRR